MKHEDFISQVRDIAVGRIDNLDERKRLLDAKLVYGSGHKSGARGMTFYGAWQNGSQHDFMEVTATGEESPIQLVGTTIHELAHVLAGPLAGHGKEWKAAAERLGLVHAEAAGQSYCPEHFADDIRTRVDNLQSPIDGKPAFSSFASVRGGHGKLATGNFGSCPLGIGTRGGKSRGAGSGSRLRKYVCSHGQIIRASSDELDATCNVCGSRFIREGAGQ